jgi:hypothetical protein
MKILKSILLISILLSKVIYSMYWQVNFHLNQAEITALECENKSTKQKMRKMKYNKCISKVTYSNHPITINLCKTRLGSQSDNWKSLVFGWIMNLITGLVRTLECKTHV